MVRLDVFQTIAVGEDVTFGPANLRKI